MSLSVDYIYTFSKRLIRKSQAAGFGNDEFEINWNDAQGTYQDDLLGRFQAGAKSKTGVNTGLIQDETIMQKLHPFITPVTLTIINGVSDKPDDFIYRLAERANGKDIFKINHNQIANVNDSVIDPPSLDQQTYYFVEYLDYFKFLPETLTSFDLDYIATPTDIKWGYTWDANNRQVYNQGLSDQPQWDNNSCREITKRMLKTLGVSFKDSDFATFGQSVIVAGD